MYSTFHVFTFHVFTFQFHVTELSPAGWR
jgi:hypothetical protein